MAVHYHIRIKQLLKKAKKKKLLSFLFFNPLHKSDYDFLSGLTHIMSSFFFHQIYERSAAQEI